MKKAVKIISILFSMLFLGYLFLPNPSFPNPPPDALQSMEPADMEDLSVKRAYFTNFTREEVMVHYHNQLNRSPLINLPVPTYRLNYPPEEAQSIIREQTRSVFLEEIVHPFRESLFVNGFEAKKEKDTILIEGKIWRQKTTVRYVPSSIWPRLGIGVLTLVLVIFLSKEWFVSCRKIKECFKHA